MNIDRVPEGPGLVGGLPEAPIGAGAGLWEDVRQARRRTLLLDYDGTLAPLRVRRDEAVPFPGTLERLRALVDGGTTAVAIVSGRPLGELVALLGDGPRVHLIGEHGWEERTPDGGLLRHAPGPRVEARLDEALALARRCGFGGRIERKRTGLVVHVRGVAGHAAAEILESCADLWGAFADGVLLRLDFPSHGLELRAAARDKGTVVREWVDRAGAGACTVYVGDDQTDEDAFRALAGSGLGIRVGAPGTPTAASARLPGPGALPEFLDRWIAATSRSPGPVEES